MLTINTMFALPQAGADLSPGRSHSVMPGTDTLQELCSANAVYLVRPAPLGSCTSFNRHTLALDVAYYAEADTLAHCFSMAKREDSQRRNYRAAIAQIEATGNQYVAESL